VIPIFLGNGHERAHSPEDKFLARASDVNLAESSKKKPPENNWLLLGQLKLSVDSISDETIDHWLSKTFKSFDLPSDLFNRLKASIKEALSRLITTPDYSHASSINIFISDDTKNDLLSNNYWGFFRLEKVDNTLDEETPVEHLIDFYLYFLYRTFEVKGQS
jgi:hypothetical protein